VVFQGIQREQSTFGKRRTWSEHGKIASYFLWLVKVAIDRFDEELESNKGGLVINPLPFSFDKSCFDRFNEDLESNEGRTSLYTLSLSGHMGIKYKSRYRRAEPYKRRQAFFYKTCHAQSLKQLRERKAARDMSGRCLRFRPKICTLDD
jgi:hypothetical protein